MNLLRQLYTNTTVITFLGQNHVLVHCIWFAKALNIGQSLAMYGTEERRGEESRCARQWLFCASNLPALPHGFSAI